MKNEKSIPKPNCIGIGSDLFETYISLTISHVLPNESGKKRDKSGNREIGSDEDNHLRRQEIH